MSSGQFFMNNSNFCPKSNFCLKSKYLTLAFLTRKKISQNVNFSVKKYKWYYVKKFNVKNTRNIVLKIIVLKKLKKNYVKNISVKKSQSLSKNWNRLTVIFFQIDTVFPFNKKISLDFRFIIAFIFQKKEFWWRPSFW